MPRVTVSDNENANAMLLSRNNIDAPKSNDNFSSLSSISEENKNL
jgi:hypothetical protein